MLTEDKLEEQRVEGGIKTLKDHNAGNTADDFIMTIYIVDTLHYYRIQSHYKTKQLMLLKQSNLWTY